jgi:hypothetical protein
MDLCRTLASHRVHPLRWRQVTMWRYPEPSYPNCSFTAELAGAEDPWSRGTSALRLHPDYLERWGCQPLGESAQAYSCLIVSFSIVLMPAMLILQDLGCIHNDSQGITLAEDVARLEANCAENERQYAWKHKRRPKGIAGPPQRHDGRRPLLSHSPWETMRKGRMRKRRK